MMRCEEGGGRVCVCVYVCDLLLTTVIGELASLFCVSLMKLLNVPVSVCVCTCVNVGVDGM